MASALSFLDQWRGTLIRMALFRMAAVALVLTPVGILFFGFDLSPAPLTFASVMTLYIAIVIFFAGLLGVSLVAGIRGWVCARSFARSSRSDSDSGPGATGGGTP